MGAITNSKSNFGKEGHFIIVYPSWISWIDSPSSMDRSNHWSPTVVWHSPNLHRFDRASAVWRLVATAPLIPGSSAHPVAALDRFPGLIGSGSHWWIKFETCRNSMGFGRKRYVSCMVHWVSELMFEGYLLGNPNVWNPSVSGSTETWKCLWKVKRHGKLFGKASSPNINWANSPALFRCSSLYPLVN